ncbi:MAG: murein L,D-transpeptidase catalytic domain family protein [Gemmatimonadota bacterium]
MARPGPRPTGHWPRCPGTFGRAATPTGSAWPSRRITGTRRPIRRRSRTRTSSTWTTVWSGSSAGRNEVPTRFSNRPGSYMTSLGLYLTQETYGFRGASGGRRYTSVGLRMKGLSGSFNDAARRRGIVSHGAPYVSRTDAGRSQGCPAMEQARARRLLPKLAGGGLVFLFSPRHEDWLREGPCMEISTRSPARPWRR